MLLSLSKVGQDAQGLPGTLCQKVLFCFRVPACGFCPQVQSRSRGVRKQAQVGRWAGGQIVVEELDTHCRPQATDRGPEGGGGLPNVSTPQPIDRKTGEQSENVSENKGRGKKSSGQAQSLALTHPSSGSLLSPPSHQGRGLLKRFGREPEAMRESAKIGRTKRECL
jgi:hypothetical protein